MLIYKITNKINDKIYIGQTTQSLNNRIRNYRSDVKHSKRSRKIIDAMKKYGFENFVFEIIHDNIASKKEMDELERKYISDFKIGYNMELGGNSMGKHSDETKHKIGQSQLGEKNHMYGKCGNLNGMSKRVIDLTTGKIYESANLAANELNLNFSHVCASARGTRGSTGSRIFRYVFGTFDAILNNDNRAKIKRQSDEYLVLPEYSSLI